MKILAHWSIYLFQQSRVEPSTLVLKTIVSFSEFFCQKKFTFLNYLNPKIKKSTLAPLLAWSLLWHLGKQTTAGAVGACFTMGNWKVSPSKLGNIKKSEALFNF